MTPKPVYFLTQPRPADQQFEENDPVYGHVYHLGSSDDVLKMVDREDEISGPPTPVPRALRSIPTPTRKGFLPQRSLHRRSWESLPVDLSEKRLCEVRCFGTNDDMSNWAPKPKFMLAEGDTYMKRPDDDTYSLSRSTT